MAHDQLIPTPTAGEKRKTTYQIYSTKTLNVEQERMSNGLLITDKKIADVICLNLCIIVNDFRAYDVRITPVVK